MLDRFLRYVKINTRSDEKSNTIPSTERQKVLANLLKEELIEMGLDDVHIDDGWFVCATLKKNTDKNIPTIGFISHYDTADFNSENISPNIIEKYNGEDIVLNKEENIIMKVSDFPNLKNYVGKTLITTNGLTLLGADDKAGITSIMEAIKYYVTNPNIKHGDVKVAFGPDEEIGRGADNFDVKKFDAEYAYTMDGGMLGELEYESFNAASATYEITGVSVHPGTAKDKMINSNLVAIELANMFPKDKVPEKTEGYEGFYMLSNIEGRIEKTTLSYIIRDHDKKIFEDMKKFCIECADKINEKYGNILTLKLYDQYYNMGDVIKNDMRSVEVAKEAMENLNIKPLIHPIRGGTDGSKISFMGLPTPNIFVGAENFHGQYEFACLEDMEKARDTIKEIIRLTYEKNK